MSLSDCYDIGAMPASRKGGAAVSIGGVALVLVTVLAFPSAASAARGNCGQPVTEGAGPTASDCLFILRVAVGAGTCEPACICDTSGIGGTTATDALICLKSAVGQPVLLDCPCAATTTTTPPTTTTTSPTTTTTIGVTTTLGPTTTTTSATSAGVVLKGVLSKTTGRFNYNLTIGLPGADAACNTNFAGTHACTFAELVNAEAAGDLDGIEDVDNRTVTSFWAIDSSHPDTKQCHQTIAWDYQTAHTGVFAEISDLDNVSGDLGPAADGVCATQSWVGCCL